MSPLHTPTGYSTADFRHVNGPIGGLDRARYSGGILRSRRVRRDHARCRESRDTHNTGPRAAAAWPFRSQYSARNIIRDESPFAKPRLRITYPLAGDRHVS